MTSVTTPQQTSFTPSNSKPRFKLAAVIGFSSKPKKQHTPVEIQPPPPDYRPIQVDVSTKFNSYTRQRAKSTSQTSSGAQGEYSARYSRGVASFNSGTSTEGPLTPHDDPRTSYQHSLMTLTDSYDPFAAIVTSKAVKRQSSNSDKSIGRRIMNKIDGGRSAKAAKESKALREPPTSPKWKELNINDSRGVPMLSLSNDSSSNQLLNPQQSALRPSTAIGSLTLPNNEHISSLGKGPPPPSLQRVGSTSAVPVHVRERTLSSTQTYDRTAGRPHTATTSGPSLGSSSGVGRSAPVTASHFARGSTSTFSSLTPTHSSATSTTATIIEGQTYSVPPTQPQFARRPPPASPVHTRTGSSVSSASFDTSQFPRPPPTGPLPSPIPEHRTPSPAVSPRQTPSPASITLNASRHLTPTPNPSTGSRSPKPSLTQLQTELQQMINSRHSGSTSASTSTASLVPPASAVSFASSLSSLSFNSRANSSPSPPERAVANGFGIYGMSGEFQNLPSGSKTSMHDYPSLMEEDEGVSSSREASKTSFSRFADESVLSDEADASSPGGKKDSSRKLTKQLASPPLGSSTYSQTNRSHPESISPSHTAHPSFPRRPSFSPPATASSSTSTFSAITRALSPSRHPSTSANVPANALLRKQRSFHNTSPQHINNASSSGGAPPLLRHYSSFSDINGMKDDKPPPATSAITRSRSGTVRSNGSARPLTALLRNPLPPPPRDLPPPPPTPSPVSPIIQQVQEKGRKDKESIGRKLFGRHSAHGDKEREREKVREKEKEKEREKDRERVKRREKEKSREHVETTSSWFDDGPFDADRPVSPTSTTHTYGFSSPQLTPPALPLGSSPPAPTSMPHPTASELVQHIIPPAELLRLGEAWERETDEREREKTRRKKSSWEPNKKRSSIMSGKGSVLSNDSIFMPTTEGLDIGQGGFDSFETSLRPPPRRPKRSLTSSTRTTTTTTKSESSRPVTSPSNVPIRRKTSNASSLASSMVPRKGALSHSNTITSRTTATGERIEKKPSFLDMSTGRSVVLDVDEEWSRKRQRKREKERVKEEQPIQIGALDSFFEPMRGSFESEYAEEEPEEYISSASTASSIATASSVTTQGTATTAARHRHRGSFLDPLSRNPQGSNGHLSANNDMIDRASFVGIWPAIPERDSFLEMSSASIRGSSFDTPRESFESFVQ